MLKMMRPVHPLWPATVAVQTWKYSGQSEARPTSPSPCSPSPPHSLTSQTSLNLPNVPILLLNAITFRVGHRLPYVVRQTFRYPIHVILTSQNLHLDKMASWHLKKGSLIRNSWYPTPAFQPSWTVATGQHLLNYQDLESSENPTWLDEWGNIPGGLKLEQCSLNSTCFAGK